MSTLYTTRKATDWLVVHCAATKPTQDVGVKEIRRWHREKGWIDIGYHYVIRRDGVVEAGRPEHTVGAHVENYNANSIGICMAGGIDAKGQPEDNFTDAQYASLAALLRELKTKYPKADIQGHRDFPKVAKACPSFDVRKWITDTGVFTETQAPLTLGTDDEIIRCVEVTNATPTMFSLAKRFGYSVAEILAANPLLDPTQLKVGQLIRLPE